MSDELFPFETSRAVIYTLIERRAAEAKDASEMITASRCTGCTPGTYPGGTGFDSQARIPTSRRAQSPVCPIRLTSGFAFVVTGFFMPTSGNNV